MFSYSRFAEGVFISTELCHGRPREPGSVRSQHAAMAQSGTWGSVRGSVCLALCASCLLPDLYLVTGFYRLFQSERKVTSLSNEEQ